MKIIRLIITLVVIFSAAFFIKPYLMNHQTDKEFPNRPIKLIVPYKPGGGSDRVARILDEFTEKEFGNSFIFQYKDGGGGHLGIGFASKMKADGYTILSCNTPEIAIGPVSGAGSYSLDDFHFIAQIALDPIVIATNSKATYHDFKSFLEIAKKQPGQYTIGISGAKGGADIACRNLFKQLNIDIKFVIYTSGSELASAVLGGQVDIGASGLTPFLGSIESIKILGTTERIQHPELKSIKTMEEQGVNLKVGIGRVLLAPIGVDEKKIQILRNHFKNIFDHDRFKERMNTIGKTPIWEDGKVIKEKMKLFSIQASDLIETSY